MASVNVQKLHTLTGHRSSVYTIEPARASHLFFSGSGDGMIVLWDLNKPETGEVVAKLPNSIYALCHIHDRNLLAAGHNYEGIHFLDWSSKKEAGSLKLSSAAIFDIKLLDNLLLVASGDGSLTVIDLETWSVKKRIALSEKSARTIAVAGSHSAVAVGYSDNKIRVFDPADWSLRKEWDAHQNSIFTLSFSPDSKMLLSGSRDARLKAWDAQADFVQAAEVVAHMYALNHLSFSPDGKHFVTCSLDKSIKVWRYEDLTLLKVIDKARHAGHGTSVNKLLWTAFDSQLISASDDRTLSVWKLIF